MEPRLIKGSAHTDERGCITYNNDFNASSVKRIYFIENKSIDFQRGWQGHKIEQRWFTATNGSFEVTLIKIKDWENPKSTGFPISFILEHSTMDVLHVPAGYISRIQALIENSKLMAMSDYTLGEIQDEYRFPLEIV